ncbi:MAG TPA: hypothetical protein DCQ26_02325 [Marinilabiliales bacterium]|jgi:hypothetical protein|nr:MAG: hypothetical protein A2W95_12175 [Bacteroidetes bacterium GWA2_40_14]OFX58437.1 MAG: hypothetical protein A2W84_10280 [Bacteroidetes bacterium GWC2_40_13]OFX71974.1 MAG: hypothetical protein A2W96_03365 [Bacteroidetes bacterium GWD2_40_43]OFX89485.1 MAG: hypothetical protein A2W97_14115 [Bacteroidetes bacterium GWE2_40_63]OFY23310.1 MAG: hypothetical protein A2W88_19775 [Bacteroidetes bacterium GWF2_40_13]OFZ28079.1 MAG: hypothetical protein A2437_04215 [Bacteroidetes bacterium RIFOXYC
MKTRFFLLVSLMVFSVLAANAQNNSVVKPCKADVQLSADNQIVVRYLDVNQNKIKVLVYNEKGEKIDGRAFKTDGMMKITYDVADYKQSKLLFKVMCKGQVACSELVTINEQGIVQIPTPINIDNEMAHGAKTLLVGNNQ